MDSDINNIFNNEQLQLYINETTYINIKKIITNAKLDKTFQKILKLCNKYNVHIFSKNEDNDTFWIINSIENINIQINKKSDILNNNYLTDMININDQPISVKIVLMDKLYNDYKKKLKDLELLLSLININYTDESFINLCCDNLNNISPNNSSQSNEKKEKLIAKYIAVYSN